MRDILSPVTRAKINTFSSNNISVDDHTNCAQANYQKSQRNSPPGGQSANYVNTGRNTVGSRHFKSKHIKRSKSYAAVVTQGPTHKTFRGENIYNHLN